MTPGHPYQVLSDCPHCRTEAAVVELMDPVHPACHLGMPADRSCRMCTWHERATNEPFAARLPLHMARCPACQQPLDERARTGAGPCPHCGYAPTAEELSAPEDLTDAERARAAVHRWALREGEDEVELFCRANLDDLSLDEVVDRLVARERVRTSFDAVAFLFPSAGGRRSSGSASEQLPELTGLVVTDDAPAAASRPTPSPTTEAMDPRTPARMLISVMVADGELRRGELSFIHSFLEQEGLPPLEPRDLRVWRPHELAPIPDPALRARLVEACVHLCHLDQERDGSEWKLIQAYATTFGIEREQVDAWGLEYDRRYATTMTRLWQALSTFFR